MQAVHPKAVSRLLSSYDGGVPAHEMAHARATDAAFEAANPDWRALSFAEKELASARDMVRRFIDGARCAPKPSSERSINRFKSDFAYWWSCYRSCQRTVRGAA